MAIAAVAAGVQLEALLGYSDQARIVHWHGPNRLRKKVEIVAYMLSIMEIA